MRCPGQDTRYWKPSDIYDVLCPACEEPVEFFKTDIVRRCGNCGYAFKNPRLDLGCAAWCPAASECVGVRDHLPRGAPKPRRLS